MGSFKPSDSLKKAKVIIYKDGPMIGWYNSNNPDLLYLDLKDMPYEMKRSTGLNLGDVVNMAKPLGAGRMTHYECILTDFDPNGLYFQETGKNPIRLYVEVTDFVLLKNKGLCNIRKPDPKDLKREILYQ